MASFTRASPTCVLFLIVLISHRLQVVLSIGATIIQGRNGWSSVAGSDAVLDCLVFPSGGIWTDYSTLCSRIGFTVNSTVLPTRGDPHYDISGPFHTSGSAAAAGAISVNCTLTVRKVLAVDSGLYGCCWLDATSGLCPPHPTRALIVTPLKAPTTTQPTTTVRQTSTPGSSTQATTHRDTTSYHRQDQGGVYRPHTSNRPIKGNVTPLPNDALIQPVLEEQTSIHRAAWSVVLVLTIVLIIVVFGVRCMKRRKVVKDRHEQLPEAEPDFAELQHPRTSEDTDESIEMRSLDSSR